MQSLTHWCYIFLLHTFLTTDIFESEEREFSVCTCFSLGLVVKYIVTQDGVVGSKRSLEQCFLHNSNACFLVCSPRDAAGIDSFRTGRQICVCHLETATRRSEGVQCETSFMQLQVFKQELYHRDLELIVMYLGIFS